MNTPDIKWFKWVIAGFLAACGAYGFSSRYNGLIGASRQEKLTLLMPALIVSGILSYLLVFKIFPRWVDRLGYKTFFGIILASALLSAAILPRMSTPPPFPENHTLEITPLNQGNPLSTGYWIQILSLQRIKFPDKSSINIDPQELDLHGDWQVHTGNILQWQGGDPGSARYQSFMQGGIGLVFRTGPEQEIIQLNWDGKDQIVDLYTPVEGTRLVNLEPGFNLLLADTNRKIMVLFAFLAEFIILTVLILLLILLLYSPYQSVRSIRHPGLLISSTAILLFLLFLTFSILQPVNFEDPNLETVIREMLDKPEAPIFRHQLLTIAKLDAPGKTISNLEGIQYLRNLSELNLQDNRIEDITLLRNLTKLTILNLRGNALTELSPLSKLTNLVYLNLHSNSSITSIIPLENLTRRETLILRDVPVRDQVNVLKNFPHLNRLNLRNTGLADTTTIGQLMATGTLQDDPVTGVSATINILDNPIFENSGESFETIRPNWENINSRAPFHLPENQTLAAPIFSRQAGFYSSPFQLELSSPEPFTTIRYTLDGSEPTRFSKKYVAPILIKSRQGEPNHLSTLINSKSTLGIPASEVFKGTVVRAKTFNNLQVEISETVTHTYFVDQEIKEKYTIPVVSLTTDSIHLFDTRQGIYKNYDEKGMLWERPVHVEFFESTGDPDLSAVGAIRIQGEGSNGYPQKSVRIYAKNSDQSETNFHYELFPGVEDRVTEQPVVDYKNFILRNSGNDWHRTLFADALMHSLVSHTTIDTQAYRPVLVFINGEYWGIHNLRQRIDEHYFTAMYGIDPDQITIMKARINKYYDGQGIFRGQPEDEKHYDDMLEFLATVDIRDQNNFETISTMMDTDSFITYQIAEIYSANADWPHSNVMWWRYETDQYTPDAPPGQDGRWRWILIDTDLGFGWPKYGGYNNNTLNTAIEKPNFGFLFRSLLENEKFRNQFINTFADHLNSSFKSERVIERINEMQSVLQPEMEEHIQRWRTMDDSIDVWEQNVDGLRQFALNRPDVVRQHIIEQFGLPGTATLNLQADPDKGYIQVNSIAIKHGTPGVIDPSDWSGIYFKGVPVQVSAVPLPGFQFTGWQGMDRDQDQTSISLDLTGDHSLLANFAPIP